MKISKLSLRYYIAGLILCLAALFFFFSYRTYATEAHTDLSKASQKEFKSEQVVIEELQSLFQARRSAPTRYEIIADKNLFSPDRKAWAPPPPPDPEVVEEKKVLPPSSRKDVVLYGTYMSDSDRKAIIEFKNLRSQPSRLILGEGDVAEDPTGKLPFKFTVRAIQKDQVTIVDNKREEVFAVGLFEHERQKSRNQQAEASILVEEGSQPEQEQATVTKTAPAAQSKSSFTRKEVLEMDDAQKDNLVKQGKLKKVHTPFGPVYEPVK